MDWRDALVYLHTSGWNADDIDAACVAVHDACEEGEYEGSDVGELALAQLRAVLNVDLEDRVLLSLRTVAALRRRHSADAEELRRALYNLDAFAPGSAGDDNPSG